jgi:hypothetical protein
MLLYANIILFLTTQNIVAISCLELNINNLIDNLIVRDVSSEGSLIIKIINHYKNFFNQS